MSKNYSERSFQGVAIDPKIIRLRNQAFWSMGTFIGLGFTWVIIAMPLAYFNDPLEFPTVLGLPLWVFLVLIVGSASALVVQLVFAYGVYSRRDDE